MIVLLVVCDKDLASLNVRFFTFGAKRKGKKEERREEGKKGRREGVESVCVVRVKLIIVFYVILHKGNL